MSGGASATFVYDGDGQRVKATVNSVTTVYIGNYYEQTGAGVTKYYYAGGQRVAMRRSDYASDNGLFYVHTDHLGSTAKVVSGTLQVGELRYKAWGETRYITGTTPTTYRFTGQREESTIGLYFYGARWYDQVLGRFVQADTVVPELRNPQALNRYSYVYNNPLRYTDSTGHDPEDWDPAWVERYKAAHGGSGPTEQDWQDYLLSLQYPGTGPNGAWTEADWLVYYQVTSWLGADLLSQIGQTGSWGAAFYTSLGINLASWNLQPGPDGTWIAVSEMVPPDALGWTWGNVIILRPSVMKDATILRWMLAHEYVHVLQYRFKGIGFGPEYLFGGKDAYEKQASKVSELYKQYKWLPPVWVLPWAGVHAQHFYWTTVQ